MVRDRGVGGDLGGGEEGGRGRRGAGRGRERDGWGAERGGMEGVGFQRYTGWEKQNYSDYCGPKTEPAY